MDYLKIGFVKKPHGIRGEFKVLPLTDDFNRFKKLKRICLCISNEYVEEEIESVKILNDEVVIKLRGFNSLEEVESFRNVYLYIERKDGVKLGEWEYYSQDIVGCDLCFEGKAIGRIIDLDNFGANDNLVVLYNGEECYYPFSRNYIDNIDLDRKIVEVNQIEGFFD